MHFTGYLRSSQFHVTNDGFRGQICSQSKTDASPLRGSLFNPDLLSRVHPRARHALREVQTVLVGIFQDKHPADKQWNRLLCWNAVGSRVAGDACHFTRGPTPASVGVIAMRIEE